MPGSKAVEAVTTALLDDERTLLREGTRIDATRRAVLTRLADERRAFAEELERSNGQSSRESWGSLGRELWRMLRTRWQPPSVGGAVAVCRSSLHRTEARYAKALVCDLPSDLRSTLLAQLERLRTAESDLRKLES
jgi:hypothetical protein